MLHPQQIQELLDRGFTLIPLKPGTKRPAVRWAHLINSTPSRLERGRLAQGGSEYAVLTGRPSGVMVLDYDAGPYLDLPGIVTPGGGRHHYFEYRDHYHHALGIDGRIDIPYIAKLYGMPGVLDTEMPVNGNADTSTAGLEYTPLVIDPDVTMADLNHCRFIRAFKHWRDQPWDNRYPLARAYASNVVHAVDRDLSLGEGYRHATHIYSTIGKPLKCATIHQSAPCPHFKCQTCELCPGVTSPYGLARRLSQRERQP